MTTSEWTTSTAWVRGSGPVKAGVVRQLILTVHESGAVRRGGWQEFTSRFRNEACRPSHRLAARCSGNPQCFPRRGASQVQDCFRCAVLSSHHLGNEGSGVDWRVRAAGASRTGRTVVVRRPSGANRCGRGTDREPFDARAWRRAALFSSGLHWADTECRDRLSPLAGTAFEGSGQPVAAAGGYPDWTPSGAAADGGPVVPDPKAPAHDSRSAGR